MKIMQLIFSILILISLDKFDSSVEANVSTAFVQTSSQCFEMDNTNRVILSTPDGPTVYANYSVAKVGQKICIVDGANFNQSQSAKFFLEDHGRLMLMTNATVSLNGFLKINGYTLVSGEIEIQENAKVNMQTGQRARSGFIAGRAFFGKKSRSDIYGKLNIHHGGLLEIGDNAMLTVQEDAEIELSSQVFGISKEENYNQLSVAECKNCQYMEFMPKSTLKVIFGGSFTVDKGALDAERRSEINVISGKFVITNCMVRIKDKVHVLSDSQLFVSCNETSDSLSVTNVIVNENSQLTLNGFGKMLEMENLEVDKNVRCVFKASSGKTKSNEHMRLQANTKNDLFECQPVAHV